MGLTIREIAARAGVSAATVSRVVNGTGAVAPEKREQVLAVLGEQQAAPRRRRSANAAGKTLGVLMLPGSESDPRVIVNKLSAITEKLPRKWSLQLLSSEILPLELEARHLRGELAGLIIAGHGGCAPELGRVFARIPHVAQFAPVGRRGADRADGQRVRRTAGGALPDRTRLPAAGGAGCRQRESGLSGPGGRFPL